MTALLDELGSDLNRVVPRFERIQRVLDRSSHPRSRTNLMIGSALASGFVLCLAGTPACGGQTADNGAGAAYDAGRDAGSKGGDIPPLPTAPVPVDDAGAPAPRDASVAWDASAMDGGGAVGEGGAGHVDAFVAPDGASVNCDDRELSNEHWEMRNATCAVCNAWGSSYQIVIDGSGRAIDVLNVSADVRKCYLSALAEHVFPCLEGENAWSDCYVLLK